MEIHESVIKRQNHLITQLLFEGLNVACIPCDVMVEVEEINRNDKSIYFSVTDVEAANSDDQEMVDDAGTDEDEIAEHIFKHFQMEA